MNYYYHEGKDLLLNTAGLHHYFGGEVDTEQLIASGFATLEDPYYLNSKIVQNTTINDYWIDNHEGYVLRQVNPDVELTDEDKEAFTQYQDAMLAMCVPD